MHTNCVRQFDDVAAAIGHCGIKVVDVSQAVTAKLQGIGKHPYTVFSHVEGVLARLVGAGITVRHNHLCKRCPVENGADASLVLVADSVEHQSLAWRKSETQAPLLPVDFMAPHRKAGPLWLGDLNRFEVGPHFPNRLHRVVSGFWRQGNDTIVIDPHNLHRIEIDDGAYPLDGVRVAVILGIADSHPDERSHQPARRLLLGTVIARAPRVDHDHVHVRDSPPGQRGLKLRITFEQLFALEELIQHDGGLDTQDMLPGGDFAGADIHYRLVRCAIGVVE